MIDAEKRTFNTSAFVIIGVLTFRGPCFTTSLSTGSTARLKYIYNIIILLSIKENSK